MILITGASGFIGSALGRYLLAAGQAVRLASRKPLPWAGDAWFAIGEMATTTDWHKALEGVDVVVHLAGRAHQLRDEPAHAATLFQQVNVDAALNLARQALASGVKRMVFVSSVGVNGNSNSVPFTESDPPNPQQEYARSKWRAEQQLQALLADRDMELVIIRPPLVYGFDAPGNFGRLIQLTRYALPLPLAAISNSRSLVSIENLVDFITLCCRHRAAAGEVFLVADGEDLSTSTLLRELAAALGRPCRLWPCPVLLLKMAARLLGKQEESERLFGSLTIDSRKARNLLGWTPPYSLQQSLAQWPREQG